MTISQGMFGELNGVKVKCFTLYNDNGISVKIITYGGVINEILVPDKSGVLENVVLGFDRLSDYVDKSPYYGAVVGRVAGRIKNGEFKLNGKIYELPCNEGQNHLHGNSEFSNSIWNAEILTDEQSALKLSHDSVDGENGYPGNLHTTVIYSLTDDNELVIDYKATTDKDTILNLTNHSYFNLSGGAKRSVCNHVLKTDAESYVELASDLIPTGNLIPVKGTPFDFSLGHSLSEGMNSNYPQNIIAGNGYDHALVFGDKSQHTAILGDPESGRRITMTTTYPSFVLYSGNQLEQKYNGVCMEAQLLPDAPHNPHFGSIILKTGDVYSQRTVYKFN